MFSARRYDNEPSSYICQLQQQGLSMIGFKRVQAGIPNAAVPTTPISTISMSISVIVWKNKISSSCYVNYDTYRNLRRHRAILPAIAQVSCLCFRSNPGYVGTENCKNCKGLW